MITLLTLLETFILHKLKITVYVLITIGFLFFSVDQLSAKDWFTVRWVDDGDTIVFSNDKRIRYIGINTPEVKHEKRKAEPFGEKAKGFNKDLVLHKKVRLEYDKIKYDRYGRLLAYVYLEDGTFVNEEMVKQGYAYCLVIKPNTRHHALLLTCQQQAMESKVGIWNNWKETESTYTGNKKSHRFHNDTCLFGQKTARKNIKMFSRKWDAFYTGFAPCKKCIGNK